MKRSKNLSNQIAAKKVVEKKSERSLAEAFRMIQEQELGEIPYGLTNDYMFRAVFQKNEKALRGLLCAILNLKPKEIISCEVTNPIILGESLNEKTCILDLKICLNNNRKVNLEMQVGNLFNWPKRSTYYLCSMYTDLKKGANYMEAVPCIHIGIVTGSPFMDRHKFISRYQLADSEDGHIYCSDLSLIMVDLSQIGELENINAEEAETIRRTVNWAKLFRTRNWREAADLAKESEEMQEALVTMRELSEDEKIREQCLGRILYDGDMEGARQFGRKEGFAEGKNQGLQAGQDRVNALNQRLLQENRLEDMKRSFTDPEFQEMLLKEFGL